MRLIDADALIKYCDENWIPLNVDAVNAQPTIEERKTVSNEEWTKARGGWTNQPERKKGKWIKARGSWVTPGGDPVWECSECGKGVHVYGIEHGTYGADVADGQWKACPNCGADMRGET